MSIASVISLCLASFALGWNCNFILAMFIFRKK